jgi:tetraacyldisaccharide 4'-kinase
MNFRLILLPLSWIYAIITSIRRWMFQKGIFTVNKYKIPTVCIGNLRVGGTGKTPHVEYLVSKLIPDHKIALLSRGYGRKTTGLLVANELPIETVTAETIGDEPLQYFSKFKDVIIAVSEKRSIGIDYLIKKYPNLDLIILDDAYQHLYVDYGLRVLLTEYNHLFTKDYPFPAGNLRESKKNARFADIILVTKTPADYAIAEMEKMKKRLSVFKKSTLFFTSVLYKNMIPLTENAHKTDPEKVTEILLITGIANPKPLQQYLEKQYSIISKISFPDHHNFTPADLDSIELKFHSGSRNSKIIVTTEKDWMRIKGIEENCLLLLPVFSIPIEVGFVEKENSFLKIIENYVSKD